MPGEVEIQRQRLETIIREMAEGIIVVNEAKEIELINRQALCMLGYEAEGKLPAGYEKFLVETLFRELASADGPVVRKEISFQYPQGSVFMIAASSFQGASSEKGFVVILRDITAEKRLERMKSDFIANVAHELRSPMTPIKEGVEIILEKMVGPVTEKQEKFLGIIVNNIDRLNRLISDLIDLSKIEEGRLELRKGEARMADLVREASEVVKMLAVRRKIELEISVPKNLPHLFCDRDRIIQVLLNLMTNAFKFTPEGGRVGLQVEATTSPDGMRVVRTTVSDSGPGISEEDARQLFEKFRQLEGPQRALGSGLGLAICKAIVTMHGGRIWVESGEGIGSRFIFTLPY